MKDREGTVVARASLRRNALPESTGEDLYGRYGSNQLIRLDYVVVVIGKGVSQSIPVGQEAGDQDHDECGYPARPSRQVGGHEALSLSGCGYLVLYRVIVPFRISFSFSN